MARVTAEDLEEAAIYLEECDAAETSEKMRAACVRVAAMLRGQIEARTVSAVAREAGVSVSAVRARMGKVEKPVGTSPELMSVLAILLPNH